jgi:hypothetical protein
LVLLKAEIMGRASGKISQFFSSAEKINLEDIDKIDYIWLVEDDR